MLVRCLSSALIVVHTAQICCGQGFDPTDPETPRGISFRTFDPYGFYGAGPGIGQAAKAQAALEGAKALSGTQPTTQQDVSDFIATLQAAETGTKDPSRNDAVTIQDLDHQPLIHVKVRVIEVVRSDALAVSSVIDFITSSGGQSPFGKEPFDNTLNPMTRRLSGINRFPVPGLIDVAGDGSGMLINLTSAHVNYVASLLATEFNGDVITAPQVTTLNGKNVIFRSGSKVPFILGQNTITGDTNNIQEFFYKHVGTFVSVTPQIVNWGNKHEGLGKVKPAYATLKNLDHTPLVPSDIQDLWTALTTLVGEPKFDAYIKREDQRHFERNVIPAFSKLSENELVGVRDDVTMVINQQLLPVEGFDRRNLAELFAGAVAMPPADVERVECQDCSWKPSDCTINLNIAVRLSDAGTTPTTVVNDEGEIVDGKLTSEQNVRAISNVVQVKSGHGVIIGGLINMRDDEQADKVPFVGDLPIVGAAFRSKQIVRSKIETLIFIEAEVLPGFDDCYDECGEPLAKSKTARDFCNGKTHLNGELCEGVLSYGLHRAGLKGDYLPPPSHGETNYWRQYKEAVRHERHHTITTQLIDFFE